MATNYADAARAIVASLGGLENIEAVTHCMTRLRFVVKDSARVDNATLKAIPGVMGVVHTDSQCQVIIGNNVNLAFQEVMKLGTPGNSGSAPVKRKITLRSIGAGILDALVGTMSPLIPAIIGGSMVKLLAMMLEMSGVLPKGSSTLIILNVIGDGAFFFLPVMVAASAALKFKTNMSLAIAIAGVLVHPNFIDLMAKAAQGQVVEFASVPVTAVKYTYTVIPALVMTWILSHIEYWVDRFTPAVTKNFLKPMLIVLIAAPIAIVFIGPLGIWIGSGISALVYTIHGYLGWLSVAIMGGLWPLLVMTGMHRVFTPTIIQTIAETGKEGMVMPSEIGANLSLGGSSLAVAFKTKNPELRQTAFAAAASAIVAGISEPALYGVNLKYRMLFIFGCIGAALGGGITGLLQVKTYSFLPVLNVFELGLFEGPESKMIYEVAAIAVAFLTPFILTLIYGRWTLRSVNKTGA